MIYGLLPKCDIWQSQMMPLKNGFKRIFQLLVIFHQYKYLKWRMEVIYYVFSCIIFQFKFN